MKSLLRIRNMIELLDRWQSIPSDYELLLEERLVLVCVPPERLERKEERRRKSEYAAHDRLKKAREIYLEVLECSPLNFLPFILAVPPIACRTWKTSEVQQRLKDFNGIRPGNEIRAILEGIARNRHIDQNAIYKRIRGLLFPTVTWPKPTTITESDDAWFYGVADMDMAPKIFSESVYKAVESSPRRVREKQNQFLGQTHCIKMYFPRHNQQDALIQLDVGFDREVIKALFPTAWERLVLMHGFESPNRCINGATELLVLVDNAHFTLQGASVSAIRTVLGPHVYHAIKGSQLRRWETDNFLLKTTDCVSLDISRRQPYEGNMHLRVGFTLGASMATQLYVN